jgi:hypothetical protein
MNAWIEPRRALAASDGAEIVKGLRDLGHRGPSLAGSAAKEEPSQAVGLKFSVNGW